MDDTLRTKDDKLVRSGTRGAVVSATMLFGAAKGVPLPELEAAAGLTLAELIDPDARVPDATLGAIWRTIAAHFPDEALGLQMAEAAPMSIFGVLAQAARHAPTRRDALHTFVRYDKVLSGGLEIRLEEDTDTGVLVLAHNQDALDHGHGAEAALALGARLGRTMLGIPSPDGHVEFAHPPNAPVSVYEAWFESAVRFETGRNAVVFPRHVLDRPPEHASPVLIRYVEAHLELVLTRLLEQVADEPLDRVRTEIAKRAAAAQYDADGLARALGMSLRTLQRYTTKHGASVRALIDAVREANARELLSDHRLSIEEVAFLVGYADDRAFRRAFKRWTGTTPAKVRSS